jgi:hypothetical protein
LSQPQLIDESSTQSIDKFDAKSPAENLNNKTNNLLAECPLVTENLKLQKIESERDFHLLENTKNLNETELTNRPSPIDLENETLDLKRSLSNHLNESDSAKRIKQD